MLTHWKKLTETNYLGSWDFQPGEEKALTIREVRPETMFNPGSNRNETKPAVHFMEKGAKPMVMNKTNGKTIAGVAGTPHVEKWAGVRIALCVERVRAHGQMVDGIRVKGGKPAQAPPGAKAEGQAPPCAGCGGEIEGYGKHGAAEIARRSAAAYGRALCAGCATERKKQQESGETGSADKG